MERSSLQRLIVAPVIAFVPLLFLPGCPTDELIEDACEGVVCESPPDAGCDGSVVVTYDSPGECHDGECLYAQRRSPCPAGYTCEDADCVREPEPTCEDIESCDEPPPDHCDGNVLVSYEAEGTCEETGEGPACVYPRHEVHCGEGLECREENGSARCAPPNVGETCEEIEPCDLPPSDYCDGNVLVAYDDQGSCVEDEEGAECVYQSHEEDCGEGFVCGVEDGVAACVPVSAPTCADIEPCDSPPGPSCMENTAIDYDETVGVCEETEQGPVCVYESTSVDCSAEETICVVTDGEATCVDLCEDVPCPPREDGCEGDELVVYSGAEGQCVWQTGECEYPAGDEARTACEPDAVCALDEEGDPLCLVPICGLAPPPPHSSVDGGYCDRAACQGEPGCEFGYNFDFELWLGDEAPGFYYFFPEDVELSGDDLVVGSGSHSARIESTAANSNRDLRAAASLKAPVVDQEYTFHAWYRLETTDETDWVRVMLWLRDEDGSLHRFGETGGNFWSLNGPIMSGSAHEWTEVTVTSPPVEADRVDLRPFLRVRSRGPEPTVAWTDDWALTVPYVFTLDEDARDQGDVDVAVTGDAYIGAAIDNAGVLYASTDGAGDLQDRFLYVWAGGVGAEMVAAPWTKAGLVAGPADGGELLALAQNEQNAYCSWMRYDALASEWETISTGDEDGSCTNAHGAVLAGAIDLGSVMNVAAVELPARLSFAAAGYGREDDEAIIEGSRVPDAQGGDIGPSETREVHRASILAGKVH